MVGEDFAEIINSKVYNKHLRPSRRIIQDNDPVQNSAPARAAFSRQKIKLEKIPSKSPDINVIENLFNSTKKLLAAQAIDQHITHESKAEYATWIENLLASYSVDKVNKLIDSLPNRMELLVKNKGIRLRYWQ